MTKFKSDKEAADAFHQKYKEITKEIGKVIVGQEEVIKQLLMGLFCKSHALLVGVPGLAKTLLVQTVAKCIDLGFKRIQFTPDLMPADILGSETLDKNREFKFIKGPLFANIILADEINRTPPKTQAALLEAMQESTVTISGVSYELPQPFFVLATQNPIEQEGTYPLPEAQLDRFMFNIVLDYPSFKEEINIVKATTHGYQNHAEPVVDIETLTAFQALVRKVPIADNVVDYTVKLVHSTRPEKENAATLTNQFIEWGAGPRASQALTVAAKCHSLILGKYAPDIEDVQAVAIPILRHRLVRNFKAEAEGLSIEEIIKQLL